MKSRIYIAIHREDLVAKGACESGLTEFDALESKDPWLIEWSPLFDVWLSVAYPSHSAWLRENGFIPRANLYGANLSRANLYGANLYGADLYGADLSGADLSGAYGTPCRLPEGFEHVNGIIRKKTT